MIPRRALLATLLALGCETSSTPPVDASRDVSVAIDASDVPAPQDVTEVATSAPFVVGSGSVTLRGLPLGLSVTRRGRDEVLRSPTARPLIEVGVVEGGPNPARFYDPRVDTPPNVTWRSLDRVIAGPTTDGDSRRITLAGEGPLRATLVLAPTARGTSLTVEATGGEVALLRFNLASDDGAYHGLGEQFAGAEARGRVVPMQLQAGGTTSGTNEQHVPVPFLVSSKGYGIFVETREAGAFDVAATDPSVVRATFEGARATLHLFEDADPLRVIAAYTATTGLPRLPPRWSFAPQQWRNEWRSGMEMLEDARRLRAEGIPTTTMWIDNPWQVSYNDGRIDERRFPDAAGLMRTLASLGYRVIFWSTPYLDAVTEGAQPRNEAERLWVQARDRGYLVRLAAGAPYVSPTRFFSPSGMSDASGSLVDFSRPEASRFFEDTIRHTIELGGRGYKLDYGEDILPELAGQRTRFRFANDETERTQRWFYPQGYHGAYRAALDRWAGGDGFLLVRQSSWGGQRVCDVIWPGDLDNDFREGTNGQVGGLPAAVSALISLSESGFPSFASDTGGYRGGRPTREALLRWAEHTALSPFMQLGGGGESHNPWTYDAEATAIYRDLARLHTALVPYFYAQGQRAARDGTPPVRSLALAFPDDVAARADRFTYLLGDDLLVAPVVVAGATTRRAHIPRGTWVHWFTRARYEGPRDVDVEAPIGRPAFFVRAGAVIPMLDESVETLSPTDAPGIVDVDDRARVRRLHLVASADFTSSQTDLGDGARVNASRSDGRVTLMFTAGMSTDRLRAELDVGTSARPTVPGFTADPRAAAGTCTNCWHFDAMRGIVHLVFEGSGTATVQPQ